MAEPWSRWVQFRPATMSELRWWRVNEFDPGDALRALRVPLLSVLGSRDLRVSPTLNIPKFVELLTGDDNLEFAVIPRANHQMNRVTTGLVDEQVSDQAYCPEYFTAMTSWLGPIPD